MCFSRFTNAVDSNPKHDTVRYGDSSEVDPAKCQLSDIEGEKELRNRAFCPWYYIMNRDHNRYPMDLAEARCRCKYGVGQGGKTACEEVFYYVRVLRRTNNCENGRWVFVARWQRISVGCTMTRR